MTRPFARESRLLPSRSSPYTPSEIRDAGIAAVEAALSPKPIAEDVGRLLRGSWGRVPRDLMSTEAGGAA